MGLEKAEKRRGCWGREKLKTVPVILRKERGPGENAWYLEKRLRVCMCVCVCVELKRVPVVLGKIYTHLYLNESTKIKSNCHPVPVACCSHTLTSLISNKGIFC